MTHRSQNNFRASAELSFNRSVSDLPDSFVRRTVPDRIKNDWWSPLRRGLIIEPSAKHHARMKQAIWLYLYLLLNADGRTGTLFRRLSTISKDSGIPKRTIRRWLTVLRRYGYITAEYNGHFWQIVITKWKPISNYSKRSPGWLKRFKSKFLANH
jgi:Helix-turn-helix domain